MTREMINYGCFTCTGSWMLKQHFLETRRADVKKLANEKGEAQAICQNQWDGSFFIVDAATAFASDFHIIEVVSGLPD